MVCNLKKVREITSPATHPEKGSKYCGFCHLNPDWEKRSGCCFSSWTDCICNGDLMTFLFGPEYFRVYFVGVVTNTTKRNNEVKMNLPVQDLYREI